MKIAVAERPIERIATQTERQFTIKATGKAFKILSSGLYKEKVLAIIRELSCNAYDAHVEAGCPQRPFDVHLPNSLEPFFSVRDYGPGLNPERIGPVYTTYFESTKTETNDQIGGLGLGSKSPFCYVDSFTVISRCEGMRRTYTCFFDENDTPSLSLMTEEPSNEEPGLEVNLPVRPHDFYEFRRKAEKVYAHFSPAPNVMGSAEYKLDLAPVLLEGDGYVFRDDSGTRDAKALMGVVAYPLDDYAVPNCTSDVRSLMNSPIEIQFGIGTLDITAGREELSYDNRTKQNIIARCEEVLADIPVKVLETFKSCKTEFDARCLYGSLVAKYSVISNTFPNAKVPFRDLLIGSANFALKKKEWPNTVFLHFTDRANGERALTRYEAIHGGEGGHPEEFFIQASKKLKIFVDDLGNKPWVGRMREFRRNTDWRVWIVRCEDAEELQRLKDTLEGVEFELLSSLPKPEPKPRTPTSVLVLDNWTKGSAYINRDSWGVADVEPEDGGVYIATVSGAPQDDQGNRIHDFGTFFRDCVNLKLWEAKDDLFSVPKSLAKKYLTPPAEDAVDEDGEPIQRGEWVHFFTRIREEFVRKLVTEDWPTQIARMKSLDNLTEYHTRLSGEKALLAKVAAELGAQHPVATFLKEWNACTIQQDFRKHYEVAAKLGIKLEAKKNVVDLKTCWKSIEEKYPMLKYTLDTYRYDRREGVMVKDISEYIKATDAGRNCAS